MAYNPATDWVRVKCPVCKNLLGSKLKNEIKSFVCSTDGCSQTEHWFYPGALKRPGKSIPQASLKHSKEKCTCESCKYRDERGKKV